MNSFWRCVLSFCFLLLVSREAAAQFMAPPRLLPGGSPAEAAFSLPLHVLVLWSGGAPPVAESVRLAMQDRRYPEAVKAIDEAAKAADAPRDYLAFLKGWALCLDKQYDASVAAFAGMEKQFPQSRWLRKARQGRGLALARKGDFRAAELIFRGEAESFLSPQRRHELANVYLEFADLCFRPLAEEQPPDYAKALEFYRRALEAELEEQRQIEVELRVGTCLQKLGQDEPAAAAYAALSKNHPQSALDIEARYRLGECRLKQRNLKEARRVWQDLLAAYAQSKSDRVPEAAFHLAETWQVPAPTTDEELNLGTAALESFIERFPSHKLAARAHLQIAQSFVARNRYEDAVAALNRFLKDPRYQTCKELPEAWNLLGGSYRAEKKFAEALAAWRAFLAKFPSHESWSSVQREIITTEYLVGLEQYKAGQYDAAVATLSEFLGKYPLDSRDPGILFLFGQIHHQQKRFDAAIAGWRQLLAKYPSTPEASHAQLRIARTLEEDLGKLEESLEAYRKAAGGAPSNTQQQAQQAVARLTGTTLEVTTERVFRSAETPRLKLVTRNVESVDVRAYKVDLETYFRKMHEVRGVRKLNISLIDPDRSFAFKVPKFAKYQKLQSTVEVPLPEGLHAGVMAVTVNSKTLETTTLMIQSDLDVIIKTSGDELFVFAQNMLTGKPWPGVKLLASDGFQVLAEAATDGQGIFRRQIKEFHDAAQTRVFAVAGGNVASSEGPLASGAAPQAADRGYLYTDMPVYSPGATVHVRGCIRRLSDDDPVVEPAKSSRSGTPCLTAPAGQPSAPAVQPSGTGCLTYVLEVFDTRGRSVHRQEVKLGPLGTFAAELMLPASSPLGNYRIVASDDRGHSYQGALRVEQVRPELVRLVVDAPRKVYYRGETIEGVVRASYYYGVPLADREIRYQLAGGRLQTGRTDRQGELRLSLPTRDFDETQTLPLVVALPEQNVQTSVNFFLATQGFSLEVSTLRPVFIAGEPLEVTVRARDAEGQPLAEKFALRVMRVTTVEGRVGERLEEEHPLATAADGAARLTLKLAKGGQYALRAEATDRFKNPVSGETTVQISDEDDQNRLRILAERHEFQVGDTAELPVHWRQPPALALVTCEGGQVLDYRLVELQTGINRLSIPITARLAPNFQFAVAVMSDASPKRRFHEATSPCTVQRALNVALSWPQKDAAIRAGGAVSPGGHAGVVQPGEPLELTVTTTGPQGRPVPAEVSLAMVEQSLVDHFAWPEAPIRVFFRGRPREWLVRTSSSITFDDRPATQPIPARLLAEQDRAEIAREEEASLAGRPAFKPAPETSQGTAANQPPANPNQNAETQADFDSLIALIESTVRPITWDDVGRRHSIAPFKTKLKIVVSQTQDVDPFAAAGSSSNAGGSIMESNRGGPGAGGMAGGQADRVGYWNAAILTGADGKAVVKIPVPERSTAWTLLAKGITADTLTGEAAEKFVARKALFGQMRLPAALVEGDQPQVGVSVYNDLLDRGPIEVRLKTQLIVANAANPGANAANPGANAANPGANAVSPGANAVSPGANAVSPGGHAGQIPAAVEQTQALDVKGKGTQELAFTVGVRPPEKPGDAKAGAAATGRITAVRFELTVSGGGATDKVQRSVSVLPYGVPVYARAGGVADGDTAAWVDCPKQTPLTERSLQVLIGPSVERSLLDVLFPPGLDCGGDAAGMATGVETASSDLLAAMGLQKLLGVGREAGGPRAEDLDARIRGGLGLLLLAQNEDGGWSWSDRGGKSERLSSARVIWALALARRAGYAVPDNAVQSALRYLGHEASIVDAQDYETRAVLLHAATMAGEGNFTVANQLHRERANLSPAALAYLALTLAEMDRMAMAGEALELLAGRNLDDPASYRAAGQDSLPGCRSDVEIRALEALASEQVGPKSPKIKALIDALLARRSGYRWTPDKATGPAMLALGQWFAQKRFEGQRYKLAVLVNDVPVATLDVDPAAGSQVVDVPAAALREGKQKVQFLLTGRGRYAYQCVYRGLVPADKLQGTASRWYVHRLYEPAFLERDGKELARGMGNVLGTTWEIHNPLTQLPVGRKGLVSIQVDRSAVPAAGPDNRLDYLVLVEPVPAGAVVPPGSVRGGFDRFEMVPGGIVFYIGGRWVVEPIHYELHGYLPGQYRVPPTAVRNAYRPEEMAVAAPAALAVLPFGAPSADPYRLSPEELYTLGSRAMERKDLKEAGQYLDELFEKWTLKPEVYKEVVQALFKVHLELGPPAKIVKYFEIIKEKWPEQEIPFAEIVKVGAAYHELGEFERSYYVFRATVEGSFTRESGVAGFLENQGEFLRSVDLMERLLSEYPPEGYLAEAEYALAQQVALKAPEAAKDLKLRKQKVNRVDLVKRSQAMLESFLTAHPDDPAADQAAFSAANELVDLKDYRAAVAACDRYAARYPQSDLLDSFWFLGGYCRFAAGQPQEALEICHKVAQTQRLDKRTGRMVDSANKWRAIYILGQIHHSLGQLADAVREYRRVEDRFSDARLSAAYLLRKAIELPEVTTIKPGSPVELELKFRNMASCDLKVYRIDLMKFTLLAGDLGGITRINLAGIRPAHEATVALGDGRDYRDRTTKLPLPLTKEGAYLVVGRGENSYASGLVLLTPLAVEVQTDPGSAEVRTMVKDTLTDHYLSGVQVKVIGSGMHDFVSGATDMRGIFVAHRVHGAPTVIALADGGRYAFFRSPSFGPQEALPERDVAGRRPNARPAADTGDSAANQRPEQSPVVDPFGPEEANPPAEQARPPVATTAPAGGAPVRKPARQPQPQRQRQAVPQPEPQPEAEPELRVVVYPVSDLLHPDSGTAGGPTNFDSLMNLITSTLDASSWGEAGGGGSISPEPRTESLVVKQTDEVHEEIARLLATMRAAGPNMGQEMGLRAEAAMPTQGLPIGGRGSAEKKILRALASPTNMDFVETPLQDVIDFLKEQHRIEIQIDAKALSDVGIDPATPITKNLKNVSLRSALKLMLRQLDLTYVIQDGALMITTPEEAETRSITVVYPVGDLISSRFRDPKTGEIWTADQADYDSLIDLITSTVQPTTWDDVGGPGSIAPFPATSSIVLSQTQDVHEQIDALLSTLRRVGGGKIPERVKPDAAALMNGMGGMGMGQSMNGMGMGGFGGQGMGGMNMGMGGGGGMRAGAQGMGGMGGGMGGMMGGMGGGMGGMMGGTEYETNLSAPANAPPSPRRRANNGAPVARPAPRNAPYVISVVPTDEETQSESTDLLEGVHNANRGNQVKQSQKLQGRYNKGMGMGGMGGMGGGVGAGAAF
jgi:hypothetical protein